MKCTK